MPSTARSRALRAAFAAVPAAVPLMEAIRDGRRRRQPLPGRGRARAADPDEPDRVGARPAGQRRAALRRVGAGGQRLRGRAGSGRPADSLYPLAIGRATLAVCRSAYDQWVDRADADLTVYLDQALRALAAGFDASQLTQAQQSLDDTQVTTPMPSCGNWRTRHRHLPAEPGGSGHP